MYAFSHSSCSLGIQRVIPLGDPLLECVNLFINAGLVLGIPLEAQLQVASFDLKNPSLENKGL